VLQYPAIIGTDFGFEVYDISVTLSIFIAGINYSIWGLGIKLLSNQVACIMFLCI
jgi:hypothetical protein